MKHLATLEHALRKAAVPAVLSVVLVTLFATTASAGSGDFVGCQDVYLQPYWYNIEVCRGPNEHNWIQEESWNTTGEGIGSCVGASEFSTCTRDVAFGYNDNYCTSECYGAYGKGFVYNNAEFLYSNYFTGWGEYK